MATYKIRFRSTGYVDVVVQADDVKDALDKAEDKVSDEHYIETDLKAETVYYPTGGIAYL